MPSRPILFPILCPSCSGTAKAHGQTYSVRVFAQDGQSQVQRFYIPCPQCNATGLSLSVIQANITANVEPEAALRHVRALDVRKERA